MLRGFAPGPPLHQCCKRVKPMSANRVVVAVGLLCAMIVAGCHKKQEQAPGPATATHNNVVVTPGPDNICSIPGNQNTALLRKTKGDDIKWTLAGSGSDTYTIKFDKQSGEQSPCDGGVQLEMHGHGASTATCSVQHINVPPGQTLHFPYSISKQDGTKCVDPSVDVQN